jgi:hypothetical protein
MSPVKCYADGTVAIIWCTYNHCIPDEIMQDFLCVAMIYEVDHCHPNIS